MKLSRAIKCLAPFFALFAAKMFAADPVPPDHAARMTKGLALFQAEVGAVLKEHCLKCHGGEKTKNDFDLATREDLLRGGTEGIAVVPFDSAKSRLVKLIRHEEGPEMPEKKPKLPAAQIARIAEWIDLGAPYAEPLVAGRKPARDKSAVTAEDKDWWAFRPLAKVAPPAGVQPVDALLAAKAGKLAFSPRADATVLLRRAFLILHGIPPTPEQAAAFQTAFARDPKAAMAQLTDELLASPKYGERWARHWLDVARFAESSGFEHDYDREGAYHYRDFVIRALNDDLPYDQFIRWQIAGDEFEPQNPLAMMATGFLGAGVFPTQITANEVERTRYDAMDDMLSTTSQAFLGLTVGCARCHDHKFDPIPARDYYRLLSTFTTTVRSVVDLEVEPEKAREALEGWTIARKSLTDKVALAEDALQLRFPAWLEEPGQFPEASWQVLTASELQSQAGATFKRLPDGSYLAQGKNGDRDTYTFTASLSLRGITGLKLEALADASMTKRGPGRADNGNFALSRIRVFARGVDGSEKEVRLTKAVADFEQNKTNLSIAASIDEDPSTGWAIDPQFGKDHAAIFTFAEPLDATALRVTLEFAVNTRHNIGRPRLSVMAGVEPTLAAPTLPGEVAAALDLVKAGQPLQPEQRAAVFEWWKSQDAGWRERQDRLAAFDKTKPVSTSKVLVCAEGHKPLRMHTQGADFFPKTYFLKRGNADLKDGEVTQSFLQVLMPSPEAAERWQWKAPAGAPYSGRRRSLANWITDAEHGAGMLAARVIVNRVWQHHFGRGLVATPNDFGRMGALSSNPELLDWLAAEFIRGGWRLKPLHRLIVSSAAWQQSTAHSAEKVTTDPANDTWTRRTPRRLEGEALRDSILAVSGVLDPTMHGAGTRDERSKRRSIYFTVKRSELIGSMVAFDQPEPLVSQGARPITTVAPQALLLLNGPQVREWAIAFAARVEKEASDPTSRIRRTYQLALTREPNAVESAAAAAFLDRQVASYAAEKKSARLALADFAQVLFGLNEFAYVP